MFKDVENHIYRRAARQRLHRVYRVLHRFKNHPLQPIFILYREVADHRSRDRIARGNPDVQRHPGQ